MKKRILFIFLVLSITPFARGCDITAGFPLPIVNGLDRGFDITQFLRVKSIIFLLLNISILSLIAAALIKRQQYIRLLSSFYNALLINLWVYWTGFLIWINYLYRDPPKILSDIFSLSFIYACSLPKKIAYLITKEKYGVPLVDDILYRIWFVIITILLTALFYWARRIKDRHIKTKPAV